MLISIALCGPALVLGGTACRSRPRGLPASASASLIPSATARAATARPVTLLKWSGDTWLVSESFQLDGRARLTVRWSYSGAEPFALWLVNVDVEVLDPANDRLLIVDAPASTSGSAQLAVGPGAFVVETEQAGGPWTVHVERDP